MISKACSKVFVCLVLFLLVAAGLVTSGFAQNSTFFTSGNLVVAVEGCGVHGGTCTNVPNGTGASGSYGDNQAAPLTLFQYSPNGTSSVSFVNSLVLPQSGSGANFPVSGEYGSSSEGTIQLSGAGQYLTLMGYGVNDAAFNSNPNSFSPVPNTALAQSGSLTGQSYTPVPRLVTLIDANGNVNSATAIYNVFNTNNPRSAFTANGTTAYISGQGASSDATAGVFYIPLDTITNTPTAITGLDAVNSSNAAISQDTRTVQIFNNTLYVSVDTKGGTGSARSFVGTLGTPPATSLFNSAAGPTQLTGFGTSKTGKLTITTGANGNGNNLNAGDKINLSPINYFFASPTVLYVADSGDPKNDSNGDNNSTGTTSIGDGGLQKWVNVSGTWTLEYTLYHGLNLVNNGSTDGTSGLYGLAGTVSGNTVLLYATNYTLNDLDPTYLYGITDNLAFTTATQAAGETFTLLDTAPANSNFKGVSFAPTIPAGDVEVTSSPSGLAFSSSGTGCAPAGYTTPQTLTWTPESSCTLSVTTPQSGGTGVQYAFAQWEDGTTSTTHVVTAPPTTATYTATFTTQYQLTTAAGTGGSVSPGGFFASGTNATIIATPAAGYYFVNFTGTASSTNNPFSLAMNGPQTITANFATQIPQAITFTTPAPSSAPYGSQFTVAATGGGSGNPVVFTSAGSCTSSGAIYTMTSGTGTCSVIANQAGNGTYQAAPQQTEPVSATQASGSGYISVTAASVINNVYPNQGDTLSATVTVVGAGGAPAGSGETVNFYAGTTLLGTGALSTVDANDSAATINITGSQLVFGGNSITAVYEGDANYSSTTSAAITVTLLSPLAIFGSSNVGTAATGQTLTYNFSSATTLTAVNVLTMGVSGLDYTDGGNSTCTAATYSAGQSCNVTVAFTPAAPGTRAGAVTLIAQGSNLPLMTWYLDGVGQSGAVTIDPGTLTPATLTGTQTPAAFGTAVDGVGNVYVVDQANGAVLKLAAGTFSQSTVVSGLSAPTGVALDGSGNLYISNGSSVVMVPNENGTLNAEDQSTLKINGLGSTRGVAVDASGDLYVADATNGDVVEVSNLGAQTTVASGLTSPHGVAVDAAGNVYVASNKAVTEYPFGGGAPVPYGTGFNNPRGVAVDAAGAVYVTDTGNNQIVRVAPGGASQAALTVTGASAPQGIAVDASGNLYITTANIAIQVNRTQAAQLNFQTTNVGSTSPTQVATVTDAGNGPLQVSNLAISANFVSEPSGGTDCTSSTNLIAGAQCGIGVAFAPTQSGSASGTVTLTDNALNSTGRTQTVPLSGAGSQVAQTITFSINAPASAAYNSNFTVAATAGSGLAVTFTSAGACSNVGATYTMTSGTGTCSVIANQAGNAEYSAAPTVTQNVSATLAPQTITFSQNAPANAIYNTNFTVAASSSSGLAVVFTSAGACSNVGATYTMTSGTGTCSVIANQSGNGNYAGATQIAQSVNASLAAQSITVTTPAPATATLKSSFTVAASSTSGLPVTFGSSGGCTNVGATYTMAASGTKACTETLNVAANSNYSAATQVTESTIVAAPITPTVSFTGAPAAAAYGTTFTVTASSNSTSTPTFTTTGPCTINNTTLMVTMTSGTGTCAMTATWAANDVYAKATATQRTTAEKVTSVITWPNPAAITYGTPLSSSQLNATANTTGTFVYTPPAGRILAAGLQSLSVRFTPSSTADYTIVTDDVELTVNPVDTTTTITSHTPNPSTVGKMVTFDFTVAQAITNATRPTGTVTLTASTGESCTGNLVGGRSTCKITFTTSGSRTVTASYPGDANNNSSVSTGVTQTVN